MSRCIANGEGGSVSVQLAIVMPALMLVLTAIIQFAVYFHAEHVAQAAAAQAVSTAGTEYGTADEGKAEAQRIVDKLASGFLEHPDVEVTRDEKNATVKISGSVMAVMPFLHLHVVSIAHGPVEMAAVAP